MSSSANGAASVVAADTSSSTLAANSLPPVSVSLHIPNSDLTFSYQSPSISTSNQPTPKNTPTPKDSQPPPTSSSGSNSRRPNPSGLETLPEASHANALNNARGPSPSSFPSQAANPIDLSHLTSVQRSLHLARNEGYDSILVELANERWKERWERLCLTPPPTSNSSNPQQNQPSGPSPANGHMSVQQGLNPPEWGSKADPGLMGGSWEVINGTPSHPATSPFGGMKKSSSRQGIAAGGNVKSGSIFSRKNKGSQETPLFTVPSPQPVATAPQQTNSAEEKGSTLQREGDEWRAAPSFRRGELNITKLEETSSLTAIVSPWLELDSLDEGIRLDSELALNQEVAYAAYLGIQHVILPAPSSDPERRPFLADYARAVSALIRAGGEGSSPTAGTWMNVSVRMPVSSPHGLGEALLRASSSGSTTSAMTAAANLRSEDDWAWETWDTIRNVCSYTPRLSLVLDLTFPLPGPNSLSRWSSEPVSSIWISSGSFLSNAKGYPVLSKAAQSLLRALLTRRPNLTLFNVNHPPPTHTRGGPSAYLQYVRHLERTAPPEKPVEVFARGYSDWLQAPLQPLMDNLEGGTYDTFERDPVKYSLYEEAVYLALKDRPATAAPAKIWVCGAGRGPLVTRCLQAAERARRAIRVVALEKNPGALIILQEKRLNEWGESRVEIKFGDMRTFEPPRDEKDKADIVVSELLGSFGDNELSPECLDGGMRFAKSTGFSIPSSYTTYLTPISSPKLYADLLSSSASPATAAQPNAVQKAAETPYVVLFKAVKLLAGDGGRGGWEKIQEGWTFEHSKKLMGTWSKDTSGLPLTNAHNVRTSTHTFNIPHAGVCHGLAGYFEAHLYGDVNMSIHPDPQRGSPDMLSWFPIYFPFREPLYLPPNSELDVHMWRLTASRRVWYEWNAEVFLPLPSPLSGSASGRVSPSSSAGASGHPPSSSSSDSSATASSILGGHSSNVTDTSAFQNALGTPRMPTTPLWDAPAPGSNSANPMGPPPIPAHVLQAQSQAKRQHQQQQQSHLSIQTPQNAPIVRIKTGMTGLMNPGGRSSWIGL